MGLKVPHGAVQARNIPVRDIGRVAYHAGERPHGPGGRLEDVQAHDRRPAREAAAADILPAYPDCRRIKLPQQHLALRRAVGHGQPHAAAAGAQVQHPAGPQVRYIGQGLSGQDLGVGPGDEHGLADVEGEAVKLPLPDEVGHRLPVQMPPGQLPDRPLRLRRHVEGRVPVKFLPGLAAAEAYQLPGLQSGGGAVRLEEAPAQLQVEVVVGNHGFTYRPHASLPSWAGMTRFMASMATSIMESSGSKVVKFCIQRPGRARKLVIGLSWPPT